MVDNSRLVGIRNYLIPTDNSDQVLVVGCGGIGTWVSIIGVMSGWENIVLIDHDRIEQSNLNRLPFTRDDVGLLKVDVLYRFLSNIRKHINIRSVPQTFENAVRHYEYNLLESKVVFCCTDTTESQDAVYQWCQQHDIEYVRGGYDEFHISITKQGPDKIWQFGPENSSYVSSWAGTAMFAAAVAICGKEWSGFVPGMDSGDDI